MPPLVALIVAYPILSGAIIGAALSALTYGISSALPPEPRKRIPGAPDADHSHQPDGGT